MHMPSRAKNSPPYMKQKLPQTGTILLLAHVHLQVAETLDNPCYKCMPREKPHGQQRAVWGIIGLRIYDGGLTVLTKCHAH